MVHTQVSMIILNKVWFKQREQKLNFDIDAKALNKIKESGGNLTLAPLSGGG